MALTTGRWVAVTVLACAAVAVAYLPPRGFEGWPWGDVLTPEYLAARRIGGAMGLEIAALRLLERRDVALAALEPGAVLYVDPAVPARLAHALEEVLARAADSLSRGPVRFAAALFLDTVTIWNGVRITPPRIQPDIRYFLPAATGEATCLTIVTVGPTHRDQALEAEPDEHVPPPASLGDLLGPCGLVAELGPPGPAMATWIRVGFFEGEAGFGARCARGNEDACHHLLFRYLETPPPPVGATRFSVRGGSGPAFGPRFTWGDAALLRGLRDSVGPTRFATLWHAEGDLAAAFELAADVPATRWIQDLVTPEDPAAFRQGDRPSRNVVLQALGLVLLAVLVAGAVAWRRVAS